MTSSVALGELISTAPVKRAGSRSLPVLSMTMHGGLVDQAAKFKKRIASADTSDYRVVAMGQLVVGFPIDEGVLSFQRLYPEAIVSPAYAIWDLADDRTADRVYLERFLRSDLAIAYYKAKLRGSTARRRSLPKDVFLDMPVPLPPIEEQRRIAGVLVAGDALRVNRLDALRKLDTLAQAVFIDMFGDPLTNPRGWRADRVLADVADVRSGITKGRRVTSTELREVPFLAVVNVQDGFIVLDPLKTIDATAVEVERYSLETGDILLTEGGDPDKLGRGAVWGGEVVPCLHQNHVFRVRVTSQSLLPEYLSWLLGSQRGKRYFLRMAKQTTGIASINMSQLKAFPVLEPPIKLQKEFVRRIEAVAGSKAQTMRSRDMIDDLLVALQQRAFRGEL